MFEDQQDPDTPVPGAGESGSPPAAASAAGPSPQASGPSRSESAKDYSWVLGLLFWIVLLGIGAYWKFHTERATLLLNAISADSLQVSGVVTHNGQALSEGTVQLTVLDALEHKYLGSETLPVDKEGRFATDPARPLAKGVASRKLQIEATFFGRSSDPEPKDRRPLVASETVHVNFTPMLGPGARWIVCSLTVPFLLLIFLFTGPLTKAKARALFMFTYGVTIFSSLIPITLTFWIARNPYLMEVMEHAPVGLLRGMGKGMENPQWLVNIGGAVVPARPHAERPEAPETGTPSEKPGEGLGPTGQVAPDSAAATPGRPPAAEASSSHAQVVGGLAIPLFVILLATLGAGINMTRKVPEIQNDYDSVAITWGAAIKAPIAVFSDTGERVQDVEAAKIRKHLIETYMYFISAPFLAIAVYYLLQVVATSVAEPVLVVIAFATGLMTNTVIGSIIAFADATLKKAQAYPPRAKKRANGVQRKGRQRHHQ